MRIAIFALLLLLAGCTTMTSVVVLDVTKKYPPAANVAILLKPPATPYVEIAKLESQGLPGEPETVLLEDARKRAAEIGADAIIVVESISIYKPPIVMYDPWPPYLPWYRDRWRSYPFGYYMVPPLHALDTLTFPGGHAYTVRSVAIRYGEPR